MMRQQRAPWFLVGLFTTTLATLALETLDTRLLSVLTWYHLSFLAVSLAMLGMSAGAVQVYLGKARYEGDAAAAALSRYAVRFSIAVAVCYLLNISLPISEEFDTNGVISLALTALALGVPFYYSGLVVSVALTRIPGRVGIVYSVDLIGAALGCLLVLWLLSTGTMSTAMFACSAIAALGALSFAYFASGKFPKFGALAVVALGALAVWNTTSDNRVRIVYSKGAVQKPDAIWRERWSIHGQVTVMKPAVGRPWYWGPGRGAPQSGVESASMFIDGGAGTSMTHWDGRHESLAWTQYDVTSLAYHLRPGGHVGIIGVGGGRDVLTALWFGAKSVTGVEINQAFVDMLEKESREFAHIADDPRVQIVHDEGRSYYTRSTEKFDVLQMALIDTWAATGAGAFTLSENGLYTLEAWDVLLERLAPRGILTVSRWFSPANASETSRLVSLATASLLRHGKADPSKHIALVVWANVANLMVSPTPFDAADLAKLRATAGRFGFGVLLAPDIAPVLPDLGAITASKSRAELDRTIAGAAYDYSPPDDDRPYFFNLLRVGDFHQLFQKYPEGGVVTGNLRAGKTLFTLLVLVTLAVLIVIFGPLARSGLPRMAARPFTASVAYFGLIGAGFMFVQIGLMQRFSVYLGHPTYAVAVTLFSMITATGIGSFVSERFPIEKRPRFVPFVALATAVVVVLATLSLQPLIDHTIRQGLLVRCLLTIALVAPLSCALGLFFPFGMRLVRGLGSNGEPWMWGVNGASGVLAAVVGVVLSMAAGIRTTLFCGALAYAALGLPALVLARARKGARERSSGEPASEGVPAA